MPDEYYSEKFERSQSGRDRAEADYLANEMETTTSELRDLRTVVTIAMKLVGSSPEQQSSIGKSYERYLDNARFPETRQLVQALLKLR